MSSMTKGADRSDRPQAHLASDRDRDREKKGKGKGSTPMGGVDHNRTRNSQKENREKPPCYFFQHDKCRYGEKCQFRHTKLNKHDLAELENKRAQKIQSPRGDGKSQGDGKSPDRAGKRANSRSQSPTGGKRGGSGKGAKRGNDNDKGSKPCYAFVKHGKCAKGDNCPYHHCPGVNKKGNCTLPTCPESIKYHQKGLAVLTPSDHPAATIVSVQAPPLAGGGLPSRILFESA